MSASLPLRCKCRRQAETSLRCARCSVPICPDCSLVAPAGMLCRGCARGAPSRLFQISPQSLGLGYLACLGAGLFFGWILMGVGRGFGFFALMGAFLYGLGIGEVALRVTGRKRGLQMEILAGVCAAVGVVGGWFLAVPSSAHALPPGYTLTFLDPMNILMLIIATASAVSRIRNL